MVRSRPQEGRPAAQRTVAPGQRAQLALYLQLRHRVGQAQRRVTVFRRNVGEEAVDGGNTQGGQHPGLLIGRVGDVVGLKVSVSHWRESFSGSSHYHPHPNPPPEGEGTKAIRGNEE